MTGGRGRLATGDYSHGLLEKALADLMTSQHETNEKMKALAESLEKTAEVSEKAARASEEAALLARDTATKTLAVVEQGEKNAATMAEVIKHLGGVAETMAEHAARIERLEKKVG